MKLLYISALTLSGMGLSIGHLQAQSSLQTLSNKAVFANEASFLNPAYLQQTRRFQLNIAPLLGFNVHAGNNIVSAGDLIEFAKMDNDGQSFAPIHKIMDNVQSQNRVFAHANITLLHASYRIGNIEKGLTLGLSVRQHVDAQVKVNEEFLRLAYGGNKQFAGQMVAFQPQISALAYTDFGIAASKTFESGDWRITPGVRLRYLVGNAAFYTKNADISLYTEENGEYLELSGELEAYAGLADLNDDELTLKDIRKGLGNGMALDLGLNIDIKQLSLSIAAIDNGFVRFGKNSGWHLRSTQPTVRWEGYDIIADYEGVSYTKNALDALEIDTVRKSFRTGIGSKLVIHGNYGLKTGKDKKGMSYYTHSVGLNYLQGLANKFGSSGAPMYAVYYQWNWKNKFSAGANINGMNGLTDFGANIGGRLGCFNIGIGSNSLIAAFSPYNSRQFSLFGQLGLSF